MFKRLKEILTEKYGRPSKERTEAFGQVCFWGFASGNIVLTTGLPGASEFVAVSYTENKVGPLTGRH